MKFLITGAGVLGSALAGRLRSDGHRVVLVDREPGDGVEVLDLRDTASMETILDGVEGIFHTAGIHGLRDASRREFFEVNVRGTWNLCEAAANAGVHRFVHSSTIGVYGDGPHLALGADTPWRGATSAYNASKQLAEQVVKWYGANDGFLAVALRYGAFWQTLIDHFGYLPDAWARSGAVVDVGDVVEANVLAMFRMPLPRFAYVIVPSGGNPSGPYVVDSSATEAELGLTFSVDFHAIQSQASREGADPQA